MTISAFVDGLSSKSPIPGGGGASALIGAIGVSLCTMVANLTLGKSKYAQYQEDIEHILSAACASTEALLTFIHDDAEVFEPLSKAYSIPKDEPNKSEILEAALLVACSVPMNVLREVSRMIDAIEQLSAKGSKLALSDVGVAAAACRSAMEGAVMNIYINTKLMKNRDHAININNDAELLLTDGINRCNAIYQQIAKELGSNP
jgi:formiminotetrahydrofolate cyclodeaminase